MKDPDMSGVVFEDSRHRVHYAQGLPGEHAVNAGFMIHDELEMPESTCVCGMDLELRPNRTTTPLHSITVLS